MATGYQHEGITPRKPRQHRDPAFWGLFAFEQHAAGVPNGTLECHDGHQVVGTIKVVGATTCTNPMGGTKHAAERLEVTLPNGTVVPATRLVGSNHAVCQNFAYKAFRPTKRS